MAFPKQSEVEIPLLQVLLQTGGSAKPKEIYPKVTTFFPELTADEQEERLESSPSTRKWWNLIQWVRQHLVETGEIDGATRGIWSITDVGRARLAALPKAAPKSSTTKIQDVTLRDLSNRSRDDAKARLLSELKQLTATGFEHFLYGATSTVGLSKRCSD